MKVRFLGLLTSPTYAQLPSVDQGANAPDGAPGIKPRLAALVASKRFRWIAGLSIFATFIFFGLRSHERFTGSAPSEEASDPSIPSPPPSNELDHDWSRFAYTQYVTNSEYLCNSVMLFESLDRLHSKADRVMMYPRRMLEPTASDSTTHDGSLLIKAREKYGVKLVPIEVQHRAGGDPTWADSFTKLLAFNQTSYDRVLSLDSDSVITQNMDELFLLPPCPVAMPRAYWLYPEKPILSSQVLLVTPSKVEFARVQARVEAAGPNDYDMEIVNYLYKDTALVIPHRPYDVLTQEFRAKAHEKYLGSKEEAWDPVAVFNEAKFIHFSDWPVPKPWLPTPEDLLDEHQPEHAPDNRRQWMEVLDPAALTPAETAILNNQNVLAAQNERILRCLERADKSSSKLNDHENGTESKGQTPWRDELDSERSDALEAIITSVHSQTISSLWAIYTITLNDEFIASQATNDRLVGFLREFVRSVIRVAKQDPDAQVLVHNLGTILPHDEWILKMMSYYHHTED
ncbi:hypothetical protein ACHAQA_005993 [Verticillium albo-atrum]